MGTTVIVLLVISAIVAVFLINSQFHERVR